MVNDLSARLRARPAANVDTHRLMCEAADAIVKQDQLIAALNDMVRELTTHADRLRAAAADLLEEIRGGRDAALSSVDEAIDAYDNYMREC